MKDSNTVVLAIIGAIVIGAVGFFAGRHTVFGFGRQAAFGNNVMVKGARFGMHGGSMMGGKFGRGMMGGGFGEITKIEGDKVTLKISDDTTKEITLAGDASVYTMTKGDRSALKVGQTIHMMGGGFWGDTQTVIVKP